MIMHDSSRRTVVCASDAMSVRWRHHRS